MTDGISAPGDPGCAPSEPAGSDVLRAEWALHRRTSLACRAAEDAGVPGGFRTWDDAGLLAVLATDPALAFLCTISGVTRDNVATAIDLAAAPLWPDGGPTLVMSGLGPAAAEAMRAAGLVRAQDRGLAVQRLGASRVDVDIAGDVIEVGDADAAFARTLLGGYEVDGAVGAFIAAEHRLPGVRRFLVVDGDVPVAAAAMSVHGEVAVLGGASTLRAHRGRGGQTRLLHHRLRTAADAGCSLAVATVVPGSVSAANLRHAGFTIHGREAWRRG